MAVKIEIKGPVISDDSAWFYEMFDSPAVYPKRIKSELENANGEDVILIINCNGGTVTSAFEIIDAIREYTGHVTARIICAMSAATLIACAADEVIMPDAGIYMIHNAALQFYGSGDYREFGKKADALLQFNKSIINVYTRKTGLSRERIQDLMDEDTYMSVDRAIELGFVDKRVDEDETKNTTDVLVTNSLYPIFGEEKISKLKEMFEKAKVSESDTGKSPGNDSASDNPGSSPAKNADNEGMRTPEMVSESDTANSGSDINIKKGKAGNTMTLEEFLKENPSEQAAVDKMIQAAKEEGVKAERTRLKELDEIAKSVTAKALSEAKYGETPTDAKELSFQAMKDDSIRAAAYLSEAMHDADVSGSGDVGQAPDEKGDNEEEKAADSFAEYINKTRGKVE